MIKNYFLTAYRNLLRNRVYALLNIAGLTLGIGCALVIYKVIDYETGFDTFREDHARIYRVVAESRVPEGIEYESGVPFPMSEAIRGDFSQFEKVGAVTAWEDLLITLENNNKFNEELGAAFVEPQFLEILGFEVLHGKRSNYLQNPEEALISQSLAAKYFGYNGTNPDLVIGQQLILNNAVRQTISGIFEDQPDQTDFPFTLFFPYYAQEELNPFFGEGKDWEMIMSNNHCYLLTDEKVDIQLLEAAFGPFLEKYRTAEASDRTTIKLLPLSEMHFSTRYTNFTGHIARRDLLAALSLIGLFLIVTGAVNFVNMATAQSMIRAKEIGIRKVLGGHRFQLVIQMLLETFMITAFALVASLGLAELLFINLDDILSYRLSLDLFQNWEMAPILLGLLLVVTLLSGLYPSILLSRISPVIAIKGKGLKGKSAGGINVRRGLVVLQFSISQFLIFATLVVNLQMQFFQETPLGFQKDGIIGFPLPENEPKTLALLRNQLVSNPGIESVSFALGAPVSGSNATTGFIYPKSGTEDRHMANFKPVDEHYIDLFGLEILAGRGLRESDDSVIVINETMVAKMGLRQPDEAIGERVRAMGNRTIIGVIRDFHTYSLHEEKVPTVLLKMPPYLYEGNVRLAEGSSYAGINNTLEFLEEKWSEAYPNYLFDYWFLDEFIGSQYAAETRVARLYQLFSLLAIFIGGVGLYGLIAFIANQKTKEIGIRKVLGATIANILLIFTTELLILLGFAFVTAIPLAYWTMENWLNDFHYRIEIGTGVVVLALVATLMIAVVTVAYNSLKTAFANPVDSLRDE